MRVLWCDKCEVVYEMEEKGIRTRCQDCNTNFVLLTGDVSEIEYRTGIKYNDWIYSKEI